MPDHPQQPARSTLRSPRPTIGFTLAHEQFPATELANLAVAAEEVGFDAVATSDHFMPWQDNQGHAGLAWVTLSAIGERTKRLLMSTAVTCPTYRYNPAVVAQAFATLSLFYPGRIMLGVGTGEALNEVPPGGGWGHYQERHARLTEAITVIRQLWTGEWVDFAGRYYHIKHAKLYDIPTQPIPIYVAGEGPDSARLAGQHGDGWITHGQTMRQAATRAAFESGARAARKDPADLTISIEHYAVYGDRAEAERWANLWRFRGNPKLVLDPDPINIEREANKVPLDQVISTWTVSEDPHVHIDAIRKLLEGGASHVSVHSPQADQRRVIEFFGREVLPAVRQGQLAGSR